ncbi:hypothetical protein L208DRAFT_1297022 [Tricholoma matsutake]|nr:hypothetical protein L208DRAFT_1297022 [Tricholoma matsutake 945]
MRNENRHICLTLDNFLGHDIQYQPQNIRLLYFEPNMTSSVQPLDAGIIRCFKARYHREFCLRMIKRDETGEHDINLMEGMLMACTAWRQVEVSNIKNCWNHAKIQGELLQTDIYETSSAQSDCGAWDILRIFATSSMTLPAAEEQLKTHLGNRYNARDWQPALDAVMNAEGDIIQAQEALAWLSSTTQLPRLTIRLPPVGQARSDPTSLSSGIGEAEKDLMDSVEELVKRKQIIGPPPTLEDLVNPIEEREVGDSLREAMRKLWLRSGMKWLSLGVR